MFVVYEAVSLTEERKTNLSSRNIGEQTTARQAKTPDTGEKTPTRDPITLRELAQIEGQTEAQGADDLTGSTFGRFRVLSVLGRGGIGVVYLAEDAALAREVALKVLASDVAGDPEHRRRLFWEARAAAALSHPSIAAVHEMGEVDGLLYIAMERVVGESLRHKLDRGPLSNHEALSIAEQALSGLAKAHELGIIHRDLKPDNIMITHEGTVKILDFGIAKFLAEGRVRDAGNLTVTEHGRLLGTPSYMSPEQANGSPVDARTDVFSFGIVLYEMLTGELPFPGKNVLSILASLERDEPKAPSLLNPKIPKHVETVILRCLNKNPAERYANAQEIWADLEDWKAEAPPEKRTEALAIPPKARGAPWLAIVASLLLCLGVLAFFVQGRDPPKTPPLPREADSSAGVTPVPTPITSIARPKTPNAAALAAYEEGLQGLRDGAYVVAHHAFERATELDPSFGAAYLRMAFTGIWNAPTPLDAQRYYRKAISFRTQLSERDYLFLDALEPILQRTPPAPEEGARKLRLASAKYPGDAEFLALQSLTVFAPDLSPKDSLALCDRCLLLDPLYADCWQPRASALARLGRVDDAIRATDHCIQVSPAANDCIADRMELHETAGQCAEMAEDARRIIASDATDWQTHRSLANALIAQGSALQNVRSILEQGAAKAPAEPRAVWVRSNEVYLSLLSGNFEEAERDILKQRREQEKNPYENVHASFARDLLVLYDAMGRAQDKANVADEFLKSREIWSKSFERSIWEDRTLWFLKAKLDAGKMQRDTYLEARARFVAVWEARLAADMKNAVWMQAYVVPASSADDAKEALAIAPAPVPLEYLAKRPTALRGALGNVFLLADRPKDAIVYLSQAAAACGVLSRSVENTIDHYRLGRAREALAQNTEACEAYRVVLSRWGNAKPQIPLINDVSARFRALACAMR